MKNRFNEEIAFVERLIEAIVGIDKTVEFAKLYQLRSMMEINRCTQLERKPKNEDFLFKPA